MIQRHKLTSFSTGLLYYRLNYLTTAEKVMILTCPFLYFKSLVSDQASLSSSMPLNGIKLELTPE